MKKNIISLLAAAAILGAFSASAFAATTAAKDCNALTDASGKSLDIHTSANVTCKYISTSNLYAIASAHTNGTREFGTNSVLGSINYTTHTAGSSALADAPEADSTFASGWTEVGK